MVFGFSITWQAKWVWPSSSGGIRSYGGGRRLSHVCRLWLLAADHGGWRCLAIASAVWDCVERRRSQHRHRGKTWFAADCGGLLCIAQRLRCSTSSKDGANNNLFCWHDGGGCMRGWCNVMLSSGGRGSSVSDRVLGNRATLFFIMAVTL